METLTGVRCRLGWVKNCRELVIGLIAIFMLQNQSYAKVNNKSPPFALCAILGGTNGKNECRSSTIKKYYRFVPSDLTGTLKPSNKPGKISCYGQKYDFGVIAGKNAVIVTTFGLFPVVSVDGHALLTLSRSADSITIQEAHIYDDKGRLIAGVHENWFWVTRDPKIAHINKQPGDSVLKIYDYKDESIFSLDFVNPNVIVLNGVFRNGKSVLSITADRMELSVPVHIKLSSSGSCYIDAPITYNSDNENGAGNIIISPSVPTSASKH